MSHTLTVPSSLPVTIHLPFAEYARAVTLAVCPSSVATGLAFSEGMSHILCISDVYLHMASPRRHTGQTHSLPPPETSCRG